uniref:Diacylglycerol kinase variant B n=1 Tax=Solanum tuberosum TaxID=4113 RepID=M1DFG1_SOLTU
MGGRPIYSVPRMYDQMVSDPNISNNPTKDEALGFPNKPLSELSQYDNDQSSREGGQNIRTISYETPPPQEHPTNLLFSAFGAHNDHSMNTFFMREVVDDAKLMEAITAAKYRNMVVVGEEYNDCELLDDLGLFAMDEGTIKYFSISATSLFDNNLRSSSIIGCGHKDSKLVHNGKNSEMLELMADSESEHNNIHKDFYILTYILAPNASNNNLHLLDVHTCPVLALNNSKGGGQFGGELLRTFRHLLNKYKVFNLGDEAPDSVLRRLYLNIERLKGNGGRFFAEIEKRMIIIVASEDGTIGWLLGVICDLTLSQQPPIATVPLEIGKENLFLENWFSITDVVGLHLNFNLNSGICYRDICHFRCVMILVKVGQVITEEIGVMPISLLS